MSSPEKIQLQGKMISAERTKEMKSTDKNNYANAWIFIEDDALQKGKESGDYWLKPLQTLSIPPGAKTSLDFQLSFASPLEIGEVLTCNGYTTANQEQLKVLSSNKIMISG